MNQPQYTVTNPPTIADLTAAIDERMSRQIPAAHLIAEAFRDVHETPEKQAQRLAEFRAKQAAQREAEARMAAELATKTDVGTVAMVGLHTVRPGLNNHVRECEGCEYQGYEADPLDWPCVNLYVLARAHGIETPT